MDPVLVTQAFIDAVNARDVDRVVGCFSADAVVQDDAGTVFAQGEEAIRAHFGQFIAKAPTSTQKYFPAAGRTYDADVAALLRQRVLTFFRTR